MSQGSWTVVIRRMRYHSGDRRARSRSNALRINAAHDQGWTPRLGAASSETTSAPTVSASEFSVGTLPWATTRPRARADGASTPWQMIRFTSGPGCPVLRAAF